MKLSVQETLTKHMKPQYKFIENPNLPTGEVSTVAISADAQKAIKKLNEMCIETVLINKNSALPKPVQSHADLQLLHLKNNKILISDEHLFLGESEKKFDIILSRYVLGNKYPEDVPLNCKIIGKHIILNSRTISKEILDFAQNEQLTVIDVNQGYSGCSVCVLDENTIITDDPSIFAAAQNFLNDTLLIEKGSIRLEGYGYGFIGGCCGKIAENKLAVNGRIESHSDYKRIIDLCEKKKIEIVELSDEALTDIGGILPLTERI